MASGTPGSSSAVSDFYRDRCLLITGATGFMGKVLVEKLLRCCPNIRTIYLLMRPKKGQDVRLRLEQLITSRLFENVRRDHAETIPKLVAVGGDILQPSLGLSPADTKLLIDNVSVVFHSAATVKFDEPLKDSVQMNVVGTRRLIELCHKMKSLVALVHVSTAYCNCDRKDIEEVVYEPPLHPQKLIETLEWMDEDMVKSITPQVLGLRPNTYTYTKAMAEHFLLQESGNLPVAIVRPSIVTAAWKEPIPGWIDNLNGPTGLLVGVGKGVVRSIFCYSDYVADLVPVDIPINLMLAVAWYTATHRSQHMLVYNCTSGKSNHVTWQDIHRSCYPGLLKHAMNDVLWYPTAQFRSNRLLHWMDELWQHYLPAYIMDMGARICGKKAQSVAMHRKVRRAMMSLEYFTTHQWNFANDNMGTLWEKLSPRDKEIFYFDVRQINWSSYLETYCLGCKLFLLKEDSSSLPAARKHMRRMMLVARFFTLLKVILLWRLLMTWSSRARRVWWFLLSLAVRLFQLLSALKYMHS